MNKSNIDSYSMLMDDDEDLDHQYLLLPKLNWRQNRANNTKEIKKVERK